MSLTGHQKQALAEALKEKLPALVAHAKNVAKLLNSGDAAEGITRSSTEMVLGAKLPDLAVSPGQVAMWGALVPILVGHADMLVHGNLELPPEEILTKTQAAQFLHCSERTLQRLMDRRKIEYLKHGAGQSARVEFERSVLVAFRESRKVRPRTARSQL